MDFKIKAELELQYFECYKFITIDEVSSHLEIKLGQWLHNINEALLSEMTAKADDIYLIIHGALQIPPNASSLITKYISPKLKRFVLNDCSLMSWSEVKAVLAPAGEMEVLDLRRNDWVNDYVVEQLAIKFAKSLRSLVLERSELTDNSLFHVGKRCLKLRNLTLDCCYKVIC